MKRTVVAAVLVLAGLMLVGALVVAGGGRTPGATEDRRTVTAPIDRLEVVMRESDPPQVALEVTAGLPSGCAKPHSHQVSRSGDAITVTVLNSMPTGDPVCTMIYGSYELVVDLGSDFRPGTTYTVQVNDKTTTFRT